MKISSLLLAALALSLPALAGEKPVAKSAVPKAVLQATKTAYPNAKVIETVSETEGTQQGSKLIYEVRLQDGTARVDLKIDPAGKLVAQEHILDAKDAPAPVINGALAPPHADWKVAHVEKVDNLETPAESGYEVTIEKAGVRREVLMTKTGTLIKEEDDDDHK